MQVSVFLLILGLTTIYAGYSDGPNRANYVGSDATSGSFGYGYSGEIPPGYAPGVANGIAPGAAGAEGVDFQTYAQFPFDFATLFQGLQQLHSQIQAASNGQATGSVPTFPGQTYDNAPAVGGYVPDGVNLHSGGTPYGGSYGGGYGTSYGGGYGGSFSSANGAPGGYSAGASASIGPQGGQQTAYLNPENPANPNVNVRFGAGGGGIPSGKPYSVYTSSSSGSGNVDGKPYGFRRASTTINDNGKVNTYVVSD